MILSKTSIELVWKSACLIFFKHIHVSLCSPEGLQSSTLFSRFQLISLKRDLNWRQPCRHKIGNCPKCPFRIKMYSFGGDWLMNKKDIQYIQRSEKIKCDNSHTFHVFKKNDPKIVSILLLYCIKTTGWSYCQMARKVRPQGLKRSNYWMQQTQHHQRKYVHFAQYWLEV